MNTTLPPPTAPRPQDIVQAQLDAYNRHDLDAWLATYSVDAVQFLQHGDELARGHAAIRQRMADRFKDPHLNARLLHRTTLENTVVDHEVVTRTGADGLVTVDMVCIYEIQGGKIAKASFVMGQARAVPAQSGEA